MVHRRRSAALLPRTMSITMRCSRSTSPVAYTVACVRLARRNDVSSTPSCATAPTRSGSSTSGVPCSITAFMTVHQHTPNSFATCDTGRAFSPTWRHASIPARRVITAWASTRADRSVHVFASHASSTQRHRRLRHTSLAGRPKHARSRISTRRRSCASARTPQREQPSTVAVDSIAITSSSGLSITSSTRNPSSPSSASASPIPSLTSGVSSSSQPSNSRNDGGTPGPRGGPSATRRSPVQREEQVKPQVRALAAEFPAYRPTRCIFDPRDGAPSGLRRGSVDVGLTGDALRPHDSGNPPTTTGTATLPMADPGSRGPVSP